jgi:putative NADH-flavin reductase
VGGERTVPFLVVTGDFAPGHTGYFRLGSDLLLGDAQGKSHTSMEDLAIAAEVERHAHSRERFTVGY